MIPIGIYVCQTANQYCGWGLAGVIGSWFWDLTIMDDFEVEEEIMKANKAAAAKRREKIEKMHAELHSGDTEEDDNMLRTCIATIPTCNTDEFKEWETTGFKGPRFEIPPWYLPYDVLMCKTEDGFNRIREIQKKRRNGEDPSNQTTSRLGRGGR